MFETFIEGLSTVWVIASMIYAFALFFMMVELYFDAHFESWGYHCRRHWKDQDEAYNKLYNDFFTIQNPIEKGARDYQIAADEIYLWRDYSWKLFRKNRFW